MAELRERHRALGAAVTEAAAAAEAAAAKVSTADLARAQLRSRLTSTRQELARRKAEEAARRRGVEDTERTVAALEVDIRVVQVRRSEGMCKVVVFRGRQCGVGDGHLMSCWLCVKDGWR